MFPAKTITQLIPDSCLMTVDQFNSEFVRKQIEDKDAHQKTVRACLTAIVRQKIEERKEERKEKK